MKQSTIFHCSHFLPYVFVQHKNKVSVPIDHYIKCLFNGFYNVLDAVAMEVFELSRIIQNDIVVLINK